jgi:hypothetical protein
MDDSAVIEALLRKPLALGRAQVSLALLSLKRSLKRCFENLWRSEELKRAWLFSR